MENGKRETRQEPKKTRKKRGIGFTIFFSLFTVMLIGVLTCAMIGGIFMTYVKTTLAPTLDVDANDYVMNQSSIIYYQDKETGDWVELQTLHTEENRILVEYSDLPKHLWQAAVAIEDERFFEHKGVDWKRTVGAAGNMFLKAKNTYGGSTITQQLLKNLTGDNEGTVKRKVTEIFRALKFEESYSKEEILEMYLNAIYLGKNCYGVQTAAQYYFGKDVGELDLAESACIIGITNNPSLYGPFSTVKVTNPDTGVVKTARELNKARQETILYKMWELEMIDQATYEAAVAEELQFIERTTTADKALAEVVNDGQTTSGAQSYFIDQVRRDVEEDLVEQLGLTPKEAEHKVLYGGCKIYTTIDPDIQAIAEDVYENDYLDVVSASGQVLRSGITIVDVTNGNVVAMVGDMRQKEGDMVWNYATDAHQQCGSSIKPISVYAPAIDANVITPASTFDNYPVRLLNDSPWPKNSPTGYSGWTTIGTGVAQSINTVAVQVVEALGVENAFSFMTENLGMTSLVSPADDPAHNDVNTSSMGLGGLTNGVTTEEMAAAYAAFANEGVYNSPRLYTKVTQDSENGEVVLLDNQTETHVAMKETTAYFMNKLLQGVVNGGTGSSANFGGMAIAGKTGTTSDNYDRYFVGYTPYYSAAVWTGYRNNEKIVYKGTPSNPALVMWKRVMSRVHEELEYKSFAKPASGITSVTVCMDSGMLAGENCALDIRGNRTHSVEVATGTAPTETCTMHQLVDYCSEGKCLLGQYCPEETTTQVAVLNCVRELYEPRVQVDDYMYTLQGLEQLQRGEISIDSATGKVVDTPPAEEQPVIPTPGDGMLGIGMPSLADGTCTVHKSPLSGILDPWLDWPWGEGGEYPEGYPEGVYPPPGTGETGEGGEMPVEPPVTPPTEPPVEPPAPEDPSGGFGDANWWEQDFWG